MASLRATSFLPALAGFSISLGALLLGPLGCEEESAPEATSGRRISLQTRLETQDPGAPFLTGLGWQVRLSRALLATGPLYYFDGAPAFSRAPSPPPRSRLASWFGPRLAWAHPGHYKPGTARGQVLQPWSIDLFAGPAELPAGDGITGVVRSGRFSFAAPSAGPAASALGAAVALAEGVAEKDGATVHFRVEATFEELSKRATEGRVEGCIFEETELQGDGTVTITVQPGTWFNLVDFSQVEPGAAGSPTTLQPGTTPHLGFVTGLAQLSAYRFRYNP
ncbi:MAG: hypothetical protein MUF64_11460 [Polyangiaceae bacterium]|nr:hypothetical protein [Polyangiaceae bacterium]